MTKNTIIQRGRWLCLAGLMAFFMATPISCSNDSNTATYSSSSGSNTAPVATIESPADDGTAYTYGVAVTLTGTGTDDEDGTLTGTSLVWSSDLDGELGTGVEIEVDDLTLGDHTITLTATDSDGETGTAEIALYVRIWDNPLSLSDNISPDGPWAYMPQVAMDDNGNAIAVWEQWDGSNYQIFKSEYRDGEWTHPTGLDDNISPDDQGAFYPQVAMDDNGNAIIVWKQSDGSKDQIFKSEYRDGAWTHPLSLSDNISPDESFAGPPMVAMGDNGDAIIAWTQENTEGKAATYKSEYRNGAWTHPSGLSDCISPSESISSFATPAVAMDNSGNAIIVWQQAYRVLMSEYRDGAWTHPDSLEDALSPYEEEYTEIGKMTVAMDDNENAIIVWNQWIESDSYGNIFKSEYRNGAWTHPSSFSHTISPDGGDAEDPEIAMDNNQNAILIWEQEDDEGNGQIFMSEYRDGAWENPASLEDSVTVNAVGATNSDVTMNDNGNAIIVWKDDTGVYTGEYRNGVWNIDTENSISPESGGEDPQVAMDSNGNAIIVWEQSDGTNDQIFMSEYR